MILEVQLDDEDGDGKKSSLELFIFLLEEPCSKNNKCYSTSYVQYVPDPMHAQWDPKSRGPILNAFSIESRFEGPSTSFFWPLLLSY